uniref:Uncharacterized protein n=1 Tax=Rhizophora mucronata TaxID=61149 RepID=A0A2P2LTC4_RHIMU
MLLCQYLKGIYPDINIHIRLKIPIKKNGISCRTDLEVILHVQLWQV